MKKIFRIALVAELIVCFSCTTLLWISGCFFALYFIPIFFSDPKISTAGILYLLWIVAGGIGLSGMIQLSSHLLQTHNPATNIQQPTWVVYISVFIGIAANLILTFMVGGFWYNSPTPGWSLAMLIFNASIICALHFVWLGFRRDKNDRKNCRIKPCSPKLPQT